MPHHQLSWQPLDHITIRPPMSDWNYQADADVSLHLPRNASRLFVSICHSGEGALYTPGSLCAVTSLRPLLPSLPSLLLPSASNISFATHFCFSSLSSWLPLPQRVRGHFSTASRRLQLRLDHHHCFPRFYEALHCIRTWCT